LQILGRIRASEQDPSPFDPDAAERQVQAIIEAEKVQREREAWEAERAKRYRRVQATEAMGDPGTTWTALGRFWETFPDYDPEHIADRVRPKPPRPRSIDLLRQGLSSFEWIPIPGKGYRIAKYPLTNAQFKVFVDAKGYQNQQWWTEAGWQQREGKKWTQPRYWVDATALLDRQAVEWLGAASCRGFMV